LQGTSRIISQEEYNTGINSVFFQVRMPLLTTAGSTVKLGLETTNLSNEYYFNITYLTSTSSRYTIFGSGLPAATYTAATVFSIYVSNDIIYYIVNGTPIYRESIGQKILMLSISSSTVSSALNLNDIQYYKTAKLPSQGNVLTEEEFMYQAEAPLMGLLASVGVNSTSYTAYFEDSANASIKTKFENDVQEWKTFNAPLTQDKVLKFVNFYVCWIQSSTPLITVNLPYSCYSKEAAGVIAAMSADKLAFYSAVMGQVNPILQTTYGINTAKVQSLILIHKHGIISKLIMDANSWMIANSPLLAGATPIPAKVTAGSTALISWLQTNTNFLTVVTPFRSGPAESFRNYTFKGVLPPSRLSYVDYHSYD
jgi:hypothetical protein